MKAFFRELLVTAGLALLIFLTVQVTIQPFIVVGPSMEPNFHTGQWLIVSKVTYIFGQPKRGDVIVLRSPSGQQENYIKRVIGLPGDTVEVKDGAVYINGTRLNEPYLRDAPNYTLSREKIPDGSYFVLGDNRDISNDSHYGWMAPRGNIVGRAWLSIWPPAEWGLAANYPLNEQLVTSTVK